MWCHAQTVEGMMPTVVKQFCHTITPSCIIKLCPVNRKYSFWILQCLLVESLLARISSPFCFSPLWEMVQEGVDLKSIKWTQHWRSAEWVMGVLIMNNAASVDRTWESDIGNYTKTSTWAPQGLASILLICLVTLCLFGMHRWQNLLPE